MSDGTSDRGAKPPRTLFSLGRTTAKKPEDASAEPAAGDVVLAEPGIDLTEAAATETATDASAPSVEPESGFLCGACESPLAVGAVFCGECGTPVAGAEDDQAHAEPEPIASGTSVDREPFVPVEEVPFEPMEEAPFVPVEEAFVPAEEPPLAAPLEPAQADPAPGPDAGVVPLAPAAVLYADPSQAKPLPGKLEGSSWAISAPGFGTTDGDFVTGDEPSPAPHDPASGPAWAVPQTEVPAAAAATAATAATSAAVTSAAPPIAGSGTTAAAMPYGQGPVESSEKKSKTGLIIGAAAAAVLVLIVGIVVLAAGGKKDDNVQAAQTTPTSGKVSSAAGPPTSASSSTNASTVTTEKTTTSTKPATADPASTTETTAVDSATTVPQVVSTTPTPTPTATPTTPRPTPAPTTATTIRPGDISATPGSGQTVNISKGGTTQIVLQNTGGTSASCTVSVEKGNLSLSRNCGPTIPPGGTVTITVRANPGFEGQGSISGLMEGLGSYSLNIFVQNGA